MRPNLFLYGMNKTRVQVVVIGAGIAGLSTAALLSKQGYDVCLIDQNWMVGGCAGTYLRKHAHYETGATTLVGLEPNMPLGILARELNLDWEATPLEVPMQIQFPDGRVLTRHKDLIPWVQESENFFGINQADFWKESLQMALGVWDASGRYLDFPPQNWRDVARLLPQFKWKDIQLLSKAFRSTHQWIASHKLNKNADFMRFVEAQLLITSQNSSHETNALFGATALAYPLVPNYYVPGGIGKVAEKLAQYIQAQSNPIELRQKVVGLQQISKSRWLVQTASNRWECNAVVSAVPVNQTLSWLEKPSLAGISDLRTEDQLWSAFQLSYELPTQLPHKALHHQIHLPEPLPGTQSKSLFVSLSAPWDTQRCTPGHQVVSVSTHLGNLLNWKHEMKAQIEEAVIQHLKQFGFMPQTPVYLHSSGKGAWEKWTGRFAGAVGGYPQLQRIKPWQMNSGKTRLPGLFLAGDTVYPGQGIPGAALSGQIAAHFTHKFLKT